MGPAEQAEVTQRRELHDKFYRQHPSDLDQPINLKPWRQGVNNSKIIEQQKQEIATLTKQVFDLKTQLDELLTNPRFKNREVMHKIIRIVSENEGVRILEMIGKQRSAYVVMARHIAMYFCFLHTTAPSTEIALTFGGKNHTTALYAKRRIPRLLRSDAVTRRKIIQYEGLIKAVCNHS